MKIEEALLLLSTARKKEMNVREAVEIIELVTQNPDLIKEVLKTAEERGLIKREATRVYISKNVSKSGRLKVRRVDCESSCKRCGIRIKNCHYLTINDHELGPYGSGCVKKVL